MVNGRFNLCKKSSVFEWYSLRESIYIKDRRELNPKIHLIANEYGMPIDFVVTGGSHADCEETIYLTKNTNAKLAFVAFAYDTNEILFYLNKKYKISYPTKT